MGMSEGGVKFDSTQKIMVVERGVLSRENKVLASWPQVMILNEGITYWSFLVSLLGAGSVGVYIASPIFRSNFFGIQNMDITRYESMFGLTKDVLDGLWDAGLCLLQGNCSFVVEATTSLVAEILDISILVLASGKTLQGV